MVDTFPEDITVTVPFGVTSTPVSWTEPTSTDNSGTSFQSPSQPSGSTFPVGTTPVTYTFTDPTGNTVQQTFDVTVIMLRKFLTVYKIEVGSNALTRVVLGSECQARIFWIITFCHFNHAFSNIFIYFFCSNLIFYLLLVFFLPDSRN